jgi:hypothetical protein
MNIDAIAELARNDYCASSVPNAASDRLRRLVREAERVAVAGAGGGVRAFGPPAPAWPLFSGLDALIRLLMLGLGEDKRDH